MKKNGFTFIELLVVITIMGVVFAAGVASYTTIARNSRDARRRSDLEAIRQALEMCRSITGIYPTSIYQSNTGTGMITCSDGKSVTMKVTPVDPKPCLAQDNGQYTYSQTADGYVLIANCLEGGTSSLTVTNP